MKTKGGIGAGAFSAMVQQKGNSGSFDHGGQGTAFAPDDTSIFCCILSTQL
jgi:hypothetical protein